MNDEQGIVAAVLDRMVLLVNRLASYPGQPTVTEWEGMQREARCIKAMAKSLRREEDAAPAAAK